MRKYISKNLEPIFIGISIGITFYRLLDLIADVIVKIALIVN
jgi:hypothetical protein